MKTLVKTKLLDPTHIEVREYELGQDLKLIHCFSHDYKNCSHIGESYMILTDAQQKKGKVVNTQTSKFYPFATYRMYKFLWKPKGKIESTQLGDKELIPVNDNTVRIVGR